MTLFGELYFFVCAGVLLIPALILGCLQKPLKYYGLVLSVAFILLALKDEPAELFYMMCYMAYQLVLNGTAACTQTGSAPFGTNEDGDNDDG